MKQSGTCVSVWLWSSVLELSASADGTSPQGSLTALPIQSQVRRKNSLCPQLHRYCFFFFNALSFPCYLWPTPPFQKLS